MLGKTAQPALGGQPCSVAFANFCGADASFRRLTGRHPGELGKDAQNRLSVSRPSHTLPQLGGYLVQRCGASWIFLLLMETIGGNIWNRGFQKIRALSVATNVRLPSHHIQPAALKALSPSL